MKTIPRFSKIGTLSVTSFLCVTAFLAHASSYGPGFSWQRSADWTVQPVSDQGTTHGNPAADTLGNPVWTYEWVQGGGGLTTANPWYTQPSQKLIWDADWYGHGYPVWARADDAGNGVSQDYTPMIAQTYLTANLANTPPIASPDQSPLVRWTNPVNQSVSLGISGTLQIGWGGETGGYPADVELVLARETIAGTFAVLFGATVQKPHNDTSFETLDVPVNLLTQINAGDSLIVSLKVDGQSNGNWITVTDPLTLSIVPEPSTFVLSVAGIIALVAFRRRSIP